MAIRGKGKKAVMAELAAHTEGVGLARVSVLRLSPGKSLRVVRNYKHLGAAAQASTKFSKEVATRCVQATAAEACLARAVCGHARCPRGLRVGVAVAIQASLLYAASTWPRLSAAQRRRLAVRYYSPLRRAVDGSWSAARGSPPCSWSEVLHRAARRSFAAALSAARLRFLARLQRAPAALLALLQVAGREWKEAVTEDLALMRNLMSPLLDQQPAPQYH